MTRPLPDTSQKHQRREHGLMLALVSPALLVILLLIVLPVSWLAWQSIYHDGFTLENYRRIFTEDIYWRSFALTFEISLAVTLVALLLGYPVAYLANSVPKGWSILILSLVLLPFWTSVLVRAYAWLALLLTLLVPPTGNEPHVFVLMLFISLAASLVTSTILFRFVEKPYSLTRKGGRSSRPSL